MVKIRYKTDWDLTKLYKALDDPQIKIDIQKSLDDAININNKWNNEESYLTDATALKSILTEYQNLLQDLNGITRVGFYVFLYDKIDQNNDAIKKLKNISTKTTVEIKNLTDFITIRLSKIGYDKLIQFANDPKLIEFKHYIEKIANEAKYILSEPEEKIINITQKTSASNWIHLTESLINTENATIINENGQKEKAPFAKIYENIKSGNKQTRESSSKAVYKILKKHSTVAENEINSILEYSHNLFRLRNIPKPYIPRALDDDMDVEAIEKIVEVIAKNYDISQRFYELKAKLLGVPKLKYHERNIPLPEIDQKFTSDQTIEIVAKTLTDLDPEFGMIFDEMITSGNCDLYPKANKQSGGFCASGGRNFPVYVLMNCNENIDDIRTLAHEMGHAINDYLMRIQTELNYGTPLSTAEVASTLIEDYALKNASTQLKSDTQKLYFLVERINDDINTIFRQIACFEFEKELHKTFDTNGYISKKEIGKIFNKYMKKTNGPAVIHDNNSAHGWIHWSHIRNFFYVYSYASGLLIAKAMQQKLKTDPKFIDKIKTFLSTGMSKSPKDIFTEMSIDITDEKFWELGVAQIRQDLDDAFKLAKKLSKI